jgi:hypothetical protein
MYPLGWIGHDEFPVQQNSELLHSVNRVLHGFIDLRTRSMEADGRQQLRSVEFKAFSISPVRTTSDAAFDCYHQSRPHLALDKQSPFPREVQSAGRIIAIPKLGGLHHRYERVAD